MPRYALLNPQGSIDRYSDTYQRFDPTVGVKSGWRWVPVEEDDAPPEYVAALESLTHRYEVGDDSVMRRWTVTRQPLDAQKAAVKAEAQRRIIALTGRMSLMDCMIKQSNANMRANELNDKRVSGGTLTAEEEAEATALRNLATAIKLVRAKSNEIEGLDPIPLDFTDDRYWGS